MLSYDYLQRGQEFHQLILLSNFIMGCAASEANLPLNSAHGSRCTAVDSLTSENKRKIRKIIQSDDLNQLIITINQLKAPLDAEISQVKSKWMMIHFCARWDAQKCMQYLLKSYFVGSALGYIDYVNAASVDGQTPLHICCTWKSEKVFTVLHFYGGLNFNARDKNSKTPYEIANQYRSKNLQDILKRYKENNVNFTMVNPERLTNPVLISQTSLKDRLQKEKKDKNLQDNSNLISEEEKKLKQQKKKMQQKILDTRQQKSQKQFDAEAQKEKITKNDKAITQKLKYQKQLQDKIDERVKIQREKYEKLIKQQQKQLQKLKNQLKIVEDNRIAQQKLQAQKQAQRYAAQQEQKMKQLAKQKERQAQKLREQKIKQQAQNPQKQEEDEDKKGQKPQVTLQQNLKILRESLQGQEPQIIAQFQQLYKKAYQQNQFTDQQFPPAIQSIGTEENENFYNIADRLVWLRPYQIFNLGQNQSIQLFENDIDPNDIMQGQLGVCYMLATVAALAKTPHHIHNMFVFSDTYLGFYILKFFINGSQKYIVVDDFIPCDIDTSAPLFTRPAGNQLWVMLLQKCWAKCIGSYFSAEGMAPELMMEDLTGAPGYGAYYNDPNQKLTFPQHVQKLIAHNSAGHSIVVCTGDIQQEGMVENHAYTLLDIINLNGQHVFKIRNPWSNTQYQGMYSENSKALTPDIRKKIGFDGSQEDGIFFLSQPEFQRLYQSYSISIIADDSVYNYIQFNSKSQQDLFFKFTLKKDCDTNVRVTQPFDRMLKDETYQYAAVVIEVGKIQKNNKVTFISDGEDYSIYGSKSIHAFDRICENLKAGQYFVHVRMVWPNEATYNSAVLSVYANDVVDLQEVQQQQKAMQLLKAMYISHALKESKQPSSDGIGTYRLTRLKGQFIFLFQTQKPGNYVATLSFSEDMMVSTELDIGKVSDFQFQIPVSKNNPGVGTSRVPFPIDYGSIEGEFDVRFTKV